MCYLYSRKIFNTDESMKNVNALWCVYTRTALCKHTRHQKQREDDDGWRKKMEPPDNSNSIIYNTRAKKWHFSFFQRREMQRRKWWCAAHSSVNSRIQQEKQFLIHFFSHLVFVFAVQCNCIRYHLDCYYFFPFSFRNHISMCKKQYCLILAVSCHHFAIVF